MRALAAPLVVALAVALAPTARADDDPPPPRGLASLSTVLDSVHTAVDGQVLEVELEHDDGRWVYEVKVLTADGRVLELEYDAVDGRLLDAGHEHRD